MQRIRIGKDILFRWRILTSGASEPLEGRDLSLEVRDMLGTFPLGFNIEDGNVLAFTLPGREQRYLGKITFTLWENRGRLGQSVVDSCDGVELVASTCMEGDDSLGAEEVTLPDGNLEVITSGGGDYLTRTEAAETYQPISDDSLLTEAKTVPGAINELYSRPSGGSSPFPVTGLIALSEDIEASPEGRMLTEEEVASVFGSTETLTASIGRKEDIMSTESSMDGMSFSVPFVTGMAVGPIAMAVYDISSKGKLSGSTGSKLFIIQVEDGQATAMVQNISQDHIIEPLLTSIPHMGSQELEALANDIVGSIHGKKVWGMIPSLNALGSGNHSLIPVSVDVYSSALIYLTYTDDNGYICKITLSSADGEWKATDNVQNDPQAFDYIRVSELTDDYVVPANATYREHIYEIAVGATAYGITGAEGVKWADGTPPEVEANTTVVVSVINNLAVWGTFREDEA